jgi:hypothetical protein
LTKMQWPIELYAWERGYDADGHWSDKLALDALVRVRRERSQLLESHSTAKTTAAVAAKLKKDRKMPALGAGAAAAETATAAARTRQTLPPPRKVIARPPLGDVTTSNKRACGPGSVHVNTQERAHHRGVSSEEWRRLEMYWAEKTAQNKMELVPGHSYLNREDLSTLQDGGLLLDEVMREMGRRFVMDTPHIALFNSYSMTKMMPLTGDPGQQLSRKAWTTIVGNGRKIGDDVKYIFAMHFVPNHWCCIIADFERQKIVYYDPLCGCPYANEAFTVFRVYLQDECDRQGSHHRPANWPLEKHNQPRQPDNTSCGVCVLLMLQLLQRDPLFFYRALEDQCHWSPEHIAKERAKFAYELLVRPNGTSTRDRANLMRARENSEIHEGLDVHRDWRDGSDDGEGKQED